MNCDHRITAHNLSLSRQLVTPRFLEYTGRSMPATKFTFLIARVLASGLLFIAYKLPGIISLVLLVVSILGLYLGLTLLFNEILSFTLATMIALMLTVLALCYWIGRKEK